MCSPAGNIERPERIPRPQPPTRARGGTLSNNTATTIQRKASHELHTQHPRAGRNWLRLQIHNPICSSVKFKICVRSRVALPHPATPLVFPLCSHIACQGCTLADGRLVAQRNEAAQLGPQHRGLAITAGRDGCGYGYGYGYGCKQPRQSTSGPRKGCGAAHVMDNATDTSTLRAAGNH